MWGRTSAYFGVQSEHVDIEAEEYHGNRQASLCLGQDPNKEPPKCKAEELPLDNPLSIDRLLVMHYTHAPLFVRP